VKNLIINCYLCGICGYGHAGGGPCPLNPICLKGGKWPRTCNISNNNNCYLCEHSTRYEKDKEASEYWKPFIEEMNKVLTPKEVEDE